MVAQRLDKHFFNLVPLKRVLIAIIHTIHNRFWEEAENNVIRVLFVFALCLLIPSCKLSEDGLVLLFLTG